MSTVEVAPLPRARLEEARALLAVACPYDDAATVAEEKLFGPPAATALGAYDGDALAGVAVVSARWLRLLAVAPAARRRGTGTRLIAAAEEAAAGVPRLRVADQPGNYLAPGIDARDEATLAFLARRGYQRVGQNENLSVPLTGNDRVTPARAATLARAAEAEGYSIRRAAPGDVGALQRLTGAFSAAWTFEAELALANDPPTVHLAWRGSQAVAFACIEANNRGLGWFGPAGTLTEHRGRGLGEALLIPCLLDAAARGHREATIAWIGPRPFYERACGAVSGRSFVALAKDLNR